MAGISSILGTPARQKNLLEEEEEEAKYTLQSTFETQTDKYGQIQCERVHFAR
jgi:hypothetical protein